MTRTRWAGLIASATISGVFGLGMFFTPGVMGGNVLVPSAMLTALALLSVACAFFAVWMQLFIGGRVGWKLLVVSAASNVLSWVLLWGVFPLIYG